MIALAKKTLRIKLGELCHVVTKGTTPTSIGLEFTDSGVPFLRIQNLCDRSVKLENVLFISEQTHQALKRSIIQPKDFLITIAGTIGRVAIVPDNFPECNCNQAVAILRFDYEKLNPQYLLHWLNTPDAFAQISGRKVTATISNLSLGQIKQLEIPLPPLPEQQKIARILDAADSLRQKDQQLIEKYTALSQSLFLDMFGDPETNPMGWESLLLQNMVQFLTSGSRGWAQYYSDEGDLFLRIQNVGNNQLLLDNVTYVNPPDNAEAKRTTVEAGDILLSITADLGRTAVIPANLSKAHINQHLAIIRLKDKYEPYYVSEYISSIGGKRQLLKLDKGGVKAGLNFSDIKSLNILNPPIELQKKYLERSQAIEAQKQLALASLEKSEALFNSLLQRAFKGELTT